MSIFGIGVDICEIARVEASIKRHGDRFVEKILHPNEKKRFEQQRFPERYLAKRFAAKEAYAKAFGTGIASGLIMPDIEVTNMANGKPYIQLHGNALSLAKEGSCGHIHLSISDEKHYAAAQVIIESLIPNS